MLEQRPDQTDVRVRGISTEQLIAGGEAAKSFSSGYRSVAQNLKKGVTIYEFSFVKPGEDDGMRYDGLIKVKNSWFLLPKLWRVPNDGDQESSDSSAVK